MFSETWRTLVRKYIVYDVPEEMAACFDCHVARCSNERFEICPTRLAALAGMRAADATPGCTHPGYMTP